MTDTPELTLEMLREWLEEYIADRVDEFNNTTAMYTQGEVDLAGYIIDIIESGRLPE